MARIRSIHPGQWSNGRFVRCSHPARLLAIAVRNEADDNGIFEADPLQLKMRFFPADSIGVDPLLDELEQTGQIHRYAAEGETYAIVRGFQKYQSPEHPSFRHPLPESLPNGFALHRRFAKTPECSRRLAKTPEASVPELESESELELEPEGKGASAPSPSPTSENSKDKPDPLEGRPELAAIHSRLRERIAEAHPKARLPLDGSPGWQEERRTVARLVDLDGYTPEDLRGCFGWLFMSQDKDALFWRGQVCAVAPLRQTKNGMAKIARIFEAWERAKASGIGGDAPSFKIPANLKVLRAREGAA